MKNIKFQLRSYFPIHSGNGIKAMLISFFTALFISAISYIYLFQFPQKYTDITAGDITMLGLNKSADFYAYFIFLSTFTIIFIFLMLFWYKRVELNNESRTFNVVEILHIMFPIAFIILFRLQQLSIFEIYFIFFAIFIFFVGTQMGLTRAYSIKFSIAQYYFYLSFCGLYAWLSYTNSLIADKIEFIFIPLFWGFLLLADFIILKAIKGKDEAIAWQKIDFVIRCSQFIIPMNLLALINTRYYYQGTQVSPDRYGIFISLMLSFIVLLLISNLVTWIRNQLKNESAEQVNLSTLIALSWVSLWNTNYNLLVNIDQFHTGETAIVYDQVVRHGLNWSKDFVSVLQGLGFVLSWINEFIFGGRFANYVPTQDFLLLIVVAITITALYFLIRNKWLLIIFAPALPLFFMNRTYLIGFIFILLLNPYLINHPMLWTYTYIATCILHVWYQPTYGGALAVALLPTLVYIWYKKYKTQPELFSFKDRHNTVKMAPFVVSLVIIGIACIPMLISALRFLRANGYETTITNGISVIQTLRQTPVNLTGYKIADWVIMNFYKYGSGLLFYIMSLYFFLSYVITENDYVKKVQGIVITVSGSMAYLMVLPAVLTRINEGLSRIGSVSFIFFGLLLVIYIYIYQKDLTNKRFIAILLGICLSCSFYLNVPPYLRVHGRVKSVVTVPDIAIRIMEDETGLTKLGNTFLTSELYLREASAVKEICSLLLSENQTYFDFTDKSVYYLLSEKPVPGLYASSMIMANSEIQHEVLEILAQKDVPIVFVNQPMRWMGISEALRSYRIYRYFMLQDYKFVRFKGCDFLVRSDIDLSPISGDIEFYSDKVLAGRNDDKIDLAGMNTNVIEKLTQGNISYTNSIQIDNNAMHITGGDPFYIFDIKSYISMNDVGLIKIKLKDKLDHQISGQFFIQTSEVGHNETNTIQFDILSDTIIIPVYKLPNLQVPGVLQNVRFDVDGAPINMEVTVEEIELFTLDDQKITCLEEQYHKILLDNYSNQIDDLFHQPNLGYLPSAWGENYINMSDRFSVVQDLNFSMQSYRISEGETEEISLLLSGSIIGSDGEFLRLSFDIQHEDKLIINNMLSYINSMFKGKDLRESSNVSIVVKGVDDRGNELNENFTMILTEDLLIPLGSSPNSLRAEQLDEVLIRFLPANEEYSIKVLNAQLLKLVN